MKILIVDDDDALRSWLAGELEARGSEVLQTHFGDGGLHLFKKNGPFDLVLSDYKFIPGQMIKDRHRIKEFTDFVSREDSGVVPAIGAILATDTQADAARFLGTKDARFARMRNRLRRLGKCFENGEPVPRQRKPYKKRFKSTRNFSSNNEFLSTTERVFRRTMTSSKGGGDLDQTFA